MEVSWAALEVSNWLSRELPSKPSPRSQVNSKGEQQGSHSSICNYVPGNVEHGHTGGTSEFACLLDSQPLGSACIPSAGQMVLWRGL